LVTTEEITSAYSNLRDAISRLDLFLLIAELKEQIEDSKKELIKRHVSERRILVGTARALRIMLLENPKKIKVKKARIRNKKIKESKKIEEVKELEEPKDSE
jgi:N12 class adenine-specific DNA methylase